MKTIRGVIGIVTFSILASYAFFLIPSTNAGYYGYDTTGDYGYDGDQYLAYDNGADVYGTADYIDYTDPYYTDGYYDDGNYGYDYWPQNADWFNNDSWFNSDCWQTQNDWFDGRFSYLNDNYSSGYYDNYMYPDSYSSLWEADYQGGRRHMFWNNSNHPVCNLQNYDQYYWDQYGYNNYYYSPSYANAIAVIDRCNANNAIVILNSNNYYPNSGLAGLTRAAITVDSGLFQQLIIMLNTYGCNANMNLDCANNQLWYDDGYGGTTADVYFKGI